MRLHRRGSPEKSVEHAGDLFMHTLGFTSIHFSQARATNQTPGIPDRRYYRPPDVSVAGALKAAGAFEPLLQPLTLWWEAKSPTGHQGPAQMVFQELVESCGEEYLVGTDAVLHDWAEKRGLVKRLPAGFLRLI